jgi:hypothetical protein
MEADAPLTGPSGVIVVDAESLKNTDGAVVHVDGYGERVFSKGMAKKLTRSFIESQEFCNSIELCFRDLI